MRTFKLTSSFLLAAVGVFPVLVACGGREVSLGTNKAQLSQVDPGSVGGNVPSCGAGDAHPNVCCEAGAGKAGTCGVYLGAPFQPCDSGWTTYPDPRSCCALDDPQNCVAPPPTPPPPPPGVCGYACEPGWYPIQNGCCQSTSNGDGVCYGWASGGSDGGAPDGGVVVGDGGIEPPSIDAGCAPSIDGGPSCDPTPPEPLPQPTCDFACPSGWQHPTGTPDVCCRDVGGQIECFSQATGPSQGGSSGGDGGTTTTDADVPPSADAGMAPD